ncbi:uncharacterized protein LOC110181248 [Drosophila serrata]|uniref:uncharacterized protein LOC110181248 n=1 Tax=Drosophila serrata TaxID=7274 RepID=UPI000A1CFA7D|nr:uncharacterized protein LOC110181248 [Drosophila serrata]
MQNHFQKTEKPLVRRRMSPLTESQLDNMPSTSKAAMAAMASSSVFGSKAFKQPKDPLKVKPKAKPKGCPIKRLLSIQLDPDYNPRARLGTASRRVLTRGQTKKDRAVLPKETPAAKVPTIQKPKPPIVITNRRFRTSQRLLPTVWHSGNVCQFSLRQICSPATRNCAENDVERWRAIECICMDLRGINVRSNVGVLKGPVSFEDVFEVLGLDEQGEQKVEPGPSSKVKVESAGMGLKVASNRGNFDIDKYLMPPLTPIQRCPVRDPRKVVVERKPRPISKSPMRVEKVTSLSNYKRN